jgi:hypothetical protein
MTGRKKLQNSCLISGCLLSYDYETEPIRTLSSAKLNSLIVNTSMCFIHRIVPDKSTYLGCDGNWTQLDGVNISKSFKLFNFTSNQEQSLSLVRMIGRLSADL